MSQAAGKQLALCLPVVMNNHRPPSPQGRLAPLLAPHSGVVCGKPRGACPCWLPASCGRCSLGEFSSHQQSKLTLQGTHGWGSHRSDSACFHSNFDASERKRQKRQEQQEMMQGAISTSVTCIRIALCYSEVTENPNVIDKCSPTVILQLLQFL